MQSFVAFIAVVALVCGTSAQQQTVAQCPVNVQGSVMQIFQWNSLPNATQMTEEQIATLQGLEEQLRTLPGFQSYIGSAINATNTLVFQIFQQSTSLASGQQSTGAFVTSSGLIGQFQLVRSISGPIVLDFVAPAICNNVELVRHVNKYMNVRVLDVSAMANLPIDQIVMTIQNGFVGTVSGLPGFREILVVQIGNNQLVTFTLFETQADALAADAALTNFLQSSGLANQIQPVETIRGVLVNFDFEFFPQVEGQQ